MDNAEFQRFKDRMKKAAGMDSDKILTEVAKATDSMFIYLHSDEHRPADLKRGLMLACLIDYQKKLKKDIKDMRVEGIEKAGIDSLMLISKITFISDLLNSLELEKVPGIDAEVEE